MSNDERLKAIADWCIEEAEAVEDREEPDDRFNCEGGCGVGKVGLMESLCPDCLRLIASTLLRAEEVEQAAEEVKRLRSLQFAVGTHSPSEVPDDVYHAWSDSEGYRRDTLKRQEERIASLEGLLRRCARWCETCASPNYALAEEALASLTPKGEVK